MEWVIGVVVFVVSTLGATSLQTKAYTYIDALTRRPQNVAIVVPPGRNAKFHGKVQS